MDAGLIQMQVLESHLMGAPVKRPQLSVGLLSGTVGALELICQLLLQARQLWSLYMPTIQL